MGNWAIFVQGLGCHHNGNPEIDANETAKAFVQRLTEQGHTVEVATFTYGGKDDLLGNVQPQNEELARCAYLAYGKQTDFKNFRGEPMPAWEDLPEAIQKAWSAAATAIEYCKNYPINCGKRSVDNFLSVLTPKTD